MAARFGACRSPCAPRNHSRETAGHTPPSTGRASPWRRRWRGDGIARQSPLTSGVWGMRSDLTAAIHEKAAAPVAVDRGERIARCAACKILMRSIISTSTRRNAEANFRVRRDDRVIFLARSSVSCLESFKPRSLEHKPASSQLCGNSTRRRDHRPANGPQPPHPLPPTRAVPFCQRSRS